jgi:long-chain acyl-CoA synthetase
LINLKIEGFSSGIYRGFIFNFRLLHCTPYAEADLSTDLRGAGRQAIGENFGAEGEHRMRIDQRLRESAARHGAHPAVVAARVCHSYAELNLKSDRLAAALQAGGIGRGDCVAVHMDDGWEAVVTVFAVLKAGAVIAPIAAEASAGELANALLQVQPAAVATQSRLAAAVSAAIAPVPSVRLVVLAGGDRARGGGTCISFEEAVGRIGHQVLAADAGSGADEAVLIAGEAALSHRELIAQAAAVSAVEDGMVLPPLARRAGLGRLLAAVDAGCLMVVQSHFGREAESDRRIVAMRAGSASGLGRLSHSLAGDVPAFQG